MADGGHNGAVFISHSLELGHVLDTTVALVNTSSDCAGVEKLGTVDEAEAFIKQWLITEVRRPTNAQLGSVRQVREQLQQVFLTEGDDKRAELVNALLKTAQIRAHIADHDQLGKHVHYFPPNATLSVHLHADCAIGLALLLTSGEARRLKVCSSPTCNRVFFDVSRNRSRVYCDSRSCGGRLHAAAYRSRRRLAEQAS